MISQADSHPPGDFYCPTCERTYASGEKCPADNTKLVKLAAPVDPFIGRELDKRYTIVEKLGQGGMGAVYRAQQHGLGREVAIKVINAALVSAPDVIKRFLREAKLASRLTHPNAVAVLDFGQTDDGVFYLVMELVAGRTLDQIIKAERSLKPERIVRIAQQVCDALDGAHALQIVHRDLKPANIILLAQGRDLVKVLDFGLAKSVGPDQTSTTMTNAGQLLGTPAFMPPELALGQPCDGRADLYSLGVILYVLTTGKLPFVSESVHELIAMHASEPAPPVTGAPAGLAHVIDRLLEKDPARRFQTAAETREALETALDGRVSTPAGGVGWDARVLSTDPSLGPFPATSGQFAHLRTPTPGSQMGPQTAAHLAASDTLVALDSTVRQPPSPSMTGLGALSVAPTGKRRRWVAPAIIAVAAAAAFATVAIVLSHGGSDDDHGNAAPPPVEMQAKPPPAAAPPPVAPPVAEPATPPPAPAAAPPSAVDKPATPAHTVKPAPHATKPPASHPTKPAAPPAEHVAPKPPEPQAPPQTKPKTGGAQTPF